MPTIPIKRQELEIPAAKEYHTKTTHPHEMWSTDCSAIFKIPGWGYYYLVRTVWSQLHPPL